MGTKKEVQKFAPAAILGNARWTGVADVASGDSGVAITSTQVKSGDSIKVNLGLTTVASHRMRTFSVNSIVDNTSFMAVVDAAMVDSQQLVWEVVENS